MSEENNIKKYEIKPWEEVLGTLVKFKDENGRLMLVLSSFIAIEITESVLNKELLREAIGRKIGILRTDDPLRPFCFRVLEGK
jgi:hypothetical protein